jgi:hypothetical protein
MQKGPKIALAVTAVFVLAVAIRLDFAYKASHQTQTEPAMDPSYGERAVSDDDMVVRRKERPDKLADEKTLIGKTVWVAAGGQVSYFPDAGKHADYSHPVGKLLGAEPLAVFEVFEQVAPTSGPGVTSIPPGKKQVLLGFTMPKSSDPKTKYAAPVGSYDDGAYTFYTDEMFFYDDPHTLYRHWGADTWTHIDKHEVVLGMSENQAMMALGQVTTPGSGTLGNQSLTFDNNGHPVTVVFEHDKATKITPGS